MGCVRAVNDVEFDWLEEGSSQIPTMNEIPDSATEKPLYALVLTPTRELAIQVCNHITNAAKHTGIKVCSSHCTYQVLN